MWLITTFGFFSIVEKPGDRVKGLLTVRARSGADLDALREKFLPTLGPTQTDKGTDYRYRAQAPKYDVVAAAAKSVSDIDYANFKDAVKHRQGTARASVYGSVWNALLDIQSSGGHDKKPSKPAPQPPKTANSFGGVLVDIHGKVLLREPRNHFDGYVWSLPKGKRDSGETPEQTALREVREETGYAAEIVSEIPGEFRGGTGTTRYFLMRPVGSPGPFDGDTQEVRWVTFEEAKKLLSLTTNKLGRQRDLAVLEAAQEALALHESREA